MRQDGQNERRCGVSKAGTCVHFNGIQNKECKAGVIYRSFHGDVPCITKYRKLSMCGKYTEPTAEQIADSEAKHEAFFARFTKVLPLVAEIKKEHKGQTWQGVRTCPVCGGRLHLSHSAYNGHVWGRCGTQDCLSWME